MVLHMVGHVPCELAVKPPRVSCPRADPSVGVSVRAHLASTVLGKLVHAQVARAEAMRQEPVQHQLGPNGHRVQQRYQRQHRVAQAVDPGLGPYKALRARGLVGHPRVQGGAAESQLQHPGDALEPEGVAAQEGGVAGRRTRGIVKVQAATAELRVFGRVIGEAVVGPVEAPEPLGAAENKEAQDLRKHRVQGLGLEGGVVHHLVIAIKQE
mmetsp:Transcript_17545/g.53011  ORF Transcript_17545/g.53011 Transcript_17545/m.53011 type:complete len:211 (-) Transcript_17545:313-945(-)